MTKEEIIALLRSISTRTTLHLKRSLLESVISEVEINSRFPMDHLEHGNARAASGGGGSLAFHGLPASRAEWILPDGQLERALVFICLSETAGAGTGWGAGAGAGEMNE